MIIEFSGEVSYTKYHYGTVSIDSGDDQDHTIDWDFTLVENYDNASDSITIEIVWTDDTPHNYKSWEKTIIDRFNKEPK